MSWQYFWENWVPSRNRSHVPTAHTSLVSFLKPHATGLNHHQSRYVATREGSSNTEWLIKQWRGW